MYYCLAFKQSKPSKNSFSSFSNLSKPPKLVLLCFQTNQNPKKTCLVQFQTYQNLPEQPPKRLWTQRNFFLIIQKLSLNLRETIWLISSVLNRFQTSFKTVDNDKLIEHDLILASANRLGLHAVFTYCAFRRQQQQLRGRLNYCCWVFVSFHSFLAVFFPSSRQTKHLHHMLQLND